MTIEKVRERGFRKNMYGWIGKTRNNKTSERGSGTDTAEYFKYSIKSMGGIPYKDVQSKNLFEKDGRYYYVLSIGVGQSSWAPYPFIENLEPIHLIMTRDIDSRSGDVWCMTISAEKRIVLSEEYLQLGDAENNIEIKKQKRKGAGEYYSLSLKNIKKITRKKEPDYKFDLNAVSSEAQSVDAIIKTIFEDVNDE